VNAKRLRLLRQSGHSKAEPSGRSKHRQYRLQQRRHRRHQCPTVRHDPSAVAGLTRALARALATKASVWMRSVRGRPTPRFARDVLRRQVEMTTISR